MKKNIMSEFIRDALRRVPQRVTIGELRGEGGGGHQVYTTLSSSHSTLLLAMKRLDGHLGAKAIAAANAGHCSYTSVRQAQ